MASKAALCGALLVLALAGALAEGYEQGGQAGLQNAYASLCNPALLSKKACLRQR